MLSSHSTTPFCWSALCAANACPVRARLAKAFKACFSSCATPVPYHWRRQCQTGRYCTCPWPWSAAIWDSAAARISSSGTQTPLELRLSIALIGVSLEHLWLVYGNGPGEVVLGQAQGTEKS